ncbi:MAG: hypothetical protein WC663_01100 [Patescibacteria group bacterium]|jgi:hypothetical protein
MKKIIILSIILPLSFIFLHVSKAEAKAKITINVDKTEITQGEKVRIYGRIKPVQTKVLIKIKKAEQINGKYKKFTSTKTNKKGKYSKKVSLTSGIKYLRVTYLYNDKKIKSKKKTVTIFMPFSLVTPYVNESQIFSVPEAYSLSPNAPWGFVHPGVDFMIDATLIPFQAVTDGYITNYTAAKESGQMGWHVGFGIEHLDYTPAYNFETFSQDDAIGQMQIANVFVQDGQFVKQGDLIGNLVYGGESAHVDFGVGYGGSRVCPESYFTSDAQASIMRLITKDHPTWPMCYTE